VTSVVAVLAVESAVVVAIGGVAFGVPSPKDFPLLVALIVLGAACFAAMGIALSRFVPNADGSSAVVNAVYLPMLFLSGAFFPVSKMPEVLRGIAEALPLTRLLEALRVAYAGGSLSAAGLGLLALWGLAGAALAARTFSWEPRTH
jgi:ABC-2 type transport system permease protein